MDEVDRLFALVDKRYREQKDFAAEIGVSASKVSQWRMRNTASYKKYLPQIARALGTTTEYILTGAPEARPREGDRLLDAIEGLTEENRQKVAEYAELLAAAQRRQ